MTIDTSVGDFIGEACAASALNALPSVCDGKEQEAFETWARTQCLDMQTHPLHWLFLHPSTDAARQAWKAAIEYCRKQAGLAPEPRP